MKRQHEDQQPQGAQPAMPERVVREYRRPMPATWWLERRPYQRFMLREATSLFVVAYAVFLLVLAGLGPEKFQAVLTHPLTVVLHVPALLMATYHSIAWFKLTPQVIVLWRGRKRISPGIIAGAHYALWLVASACILGIAKAWSGG